MKPIHDAYARDLDLNLLRVFVVVAEEGSVTRAASRLYVTQPAVSAAMGRLSSFVEAELFARQGRGIVLTSRGVELFAAARAHLKPLVAATLAAPTFDPQSSTASVRVGLSDGMEAVLLPSLLKLLRAAAPSMQLIVLPVQFRTVEDALLSAKIDLAVSVADNLPKSILRRSLLSESNVPGKFVCVYDARVTKIPKTFTERDYYAREHVVVSYAGDVRGIVEDSLGKTRKVRVSVPTFSFVGEVVDGTSLIATVPYVIANQMRKSRPHFRMAPLPFALQSSRLEILWSQVTDADPVMRFVRDLILKVGNSLVKLRSN